MTSRLSVLLLLGVLCLGVTRGDIIMDCCLKTTQKSMSHTFVKSYRIQEAGKGCEISATVILTKGGRRLCLDSPKGNPSIRALIADIDRVRGKGNEGKSMKKIRA